MVERVFVGSYFCDRRFLALGDASVAAVAEFCSARGCAATLVLPIFPQSTLAAGLARAEEILTRWSGVFDEVTVNDFGAAVWARALGLRVNWGRLFNKEARDPRYEETSLGARACALDAAALACVQAQSGATCAE